MSKDLNPIYILIICIVGGVLFFTLILNLMSDSASTKPELTLIEGGNGLSAEFSQLQNADAFSQRLARGNAAVEIVTTMEKPLLKSDNNGVTLTNADRSKEIRYKPIPNGIKEEIILYQKPETNVFMVRLTLNNMTLGKNFDSTPVFLDREGQYLFHFDKPYAIDNNGVRTDNVVYSVHRIGKSDTYEVYLEIDQQWLDNPARVYPITVDPTVINDPNRAQPEISAKRTAMTETYAMGNGILAATSDGSTQNYMDANGSWQEIDTTLEPLTRNQDYQFGAEKNSFQIYFKNDTSGLFGKFAIGNSSMRFGLERPNPSVAVVDRDTITYPNVFSNTDLKYTLSSELMLEEFIVRDRATATNIDTIIEELELENVLVEPQTDGSYNFYDPGTHDILWTIPRPVMYELGDKSHNSYGLHYALKETSGKMFLIKILDEDGRKWLGSLDRMYPVVIDTTAGPNSPGTMADDATVGTVTWSNPDNAKTSNNLYASATSTGTTVTHYLKATNFGFSIPPSATINGIVVNIEKNAGGVMTVVRDEYVKIVKADSTIGTENKASAVNWSFSDVDSNYGSSSDLWSESWDGVSINDTDFGLVLSARGIPDQCFEQNTQIVTSEGTKKIKDIRKGDKVLSFNSVNQLLEEKEVKAVWSNPISLAGSHYYVIHAGGKEIMATGNQEFYANGRYIQAEDLKVGDRLLSDSLAEVMIEDITIVNNTQDTVWDLTVEENHNFFVDGALVHNFLPPVEGYTANVDHVRMTVYYTEAAAAPGTNFDGIKLEGVSVN